MIGELFLGTGLSMIAGMLYRRSARAARFANVTGLTRATALMLILPLDSSERLSIHLEPYLQRKLAKSLVRTRRFSSRALARLAIDTLETVWREVEESRNTGDSIAAWLELAATDPRLAAQICIHLCDSDR